MDAQDEVESRHHPQRILSPLPARPRSLADELEKEEEKNSTGQHMNGNHHHFGGTGTRNRNERGPFGTQCSLEDSMAESEPGDEDGSCGKGEWFTEEDSFFEEMLGVDPLMRTEVEMLQKEKETWEAEQGRLEREKRELREQKETFERCGVV